MISTPRSLHTKRSVNYYHTKSIIPISQTISFPGPFPSRPLPLQCHHQAHLHKPIHHSDTNPLTATTLAATKNLSSSLRSIVAGILIRMSSSWSLSPCHERSLTLCFGFRMCQNIHFIHPPDLSTRSSPSPVSASLPHATPALVSLPQDPPAVLSWKEKEFPPILMRGVMFGHSLVEVECKVSNIYQIMISARLSLPRSSLHPYVITLYNFCLRSPTHGILRFLTLYATSSLCVSLSRAKIETHSTYWPCRTSLMYSYIKSWPLGSKQPLFALCLSGTARRSTGPI